VKLVDCEQTEKHYEKIPQASDGSGDGLEEKDVTENVNSDAYLLAPSP
jgi:hypothetical protein